MGHNRSRTARGRPRRKPRARSRTARPSAGRSPEAAQADARTAQAEADERFVIREVRPADLEAIVQLAQHLDSVNMPHDPAVLQASIRKARRSFAGTEPDPTRRRYMFVLSGTETGRLGGTSTIYAQHGHPDEPHVFFDVIDDERYSSTLDRHFSHVTLRLGFNYRGPSEIGALVLDPKLRSKGLGKALSFVRFLFMAMYRERFRSHVIAELMPPLEPDGTSLLWEHLGRTFTDLDYQAADKLSHSNKEFIYALFPQMPLYASLLPKKVQALIGQVGPDTAPVRRMLEDIGFRYSRRIDPFDGGPHFEAELDTVTPVRQARRLRVSTESIPDELEGQVLNRGGHPDVERRLVAAGQAEGPTRFRAAMAGVRIEGGTLVLSPATRKLLRLKAGGDVWTTSF
ncbi:MAG TPA: arginine N-succinyltransferase [Myxococcales bacterium LLY-WYZ-16_1]|nr:arginine N-succinyltransferase [Myxococcales bacterium LLY-WYZ-16_1]